MRGRLRRGQQPWQHRRIAHRHCRVGWGRLALPSRRLGASGRAESSRRRRSPSTLSFLTPDSDSGTENGSSRDERLLHGSLRRRRRRSSSNAPSPPLSPPLLPSLPTRPTVKTTSRSRGAGGPAIAVAAAPHPPPPRAASARPLRAARSTRTTSSLSGQKTGREELRRRPSPNSPRRGLAASHTAQRRASSPPRIAGFSNVHFWGGWGGARTRVRVGYTLSLGSVMPSSSQSSRQLAGHSHEGRAGTGSRRRPRVRGGMASGRARSAAPRAAPRPTGLGVRRGEGGGSGGRFLAGGTMRPIAGRVFARRGGDSP